MRRARARTSIVGAALAIVVVASLIAGEVALRVAARLNGTIARAVAAPDSGPAPVLLLPDEKLIFRGNPVYPGHDPRGYRNARPLSRADIVALGDSQTYGLSVGVDEAWPVQLGRLTRQIVYNMALPSYGPGQYVMQIDDALLLHPQQVIVAVYLGNDFFDTYLMAKRHSAALGTAVSAELRNSANALEVAHPLEPELERLWVSAEPAGPVPTPNSPLRRWVSQHLKLWRVLSLVKRQFTAQGPGILAPDFETATRALSPSQRPYASLFNDGAWRTILTAPYRLRAVDDRDARIRLGVEVSRIALRTIARRCRASGTRLLVVFPPTKEDVFWPRVRNPEDHTRLRELVENEQRLKGKLISSLAAEGVDYLDLLEPMRGAPSQPYFENADGHPNAVGHRAMAAAVATNVKAWLQAHR